MRASIRKPIIEPKWKCGECGDLHDDEDEARECCEPSVFEVYVCPTCGEEHSAEAEAIDCCNFDPDGPPPPPSAEELEAAGQMRLPLPSVIAGGR
ncbi:hypothetical protein [Nitrosospira sp. NpAV]|uniref:hypothetical protein n=1 Tax=Nitrosospira sp. NpAV TaxID=58133 RepID=UPI0005A205B3|nr:hypothetical protein [Nitrosospira sp. NpAV]KIO49624.1 hypothetical protein SQ11_05765 [Nitrosospira sp. NpAV]